MWANSKYLRSPEQVDHVDYVHVHVRLTGKVHSARYAECAGDLRDYGTVPCREIVAPSLPPAIAGLPKTAAHDAS